MSRDKILAAIKKNKPDSFPLPEIPLFEDNGCNLLKTFKAATLAIAGQVVELSNKNELDDFLRSHFPSTKKIASTIKGLSVCNVHPEEIDDPREFKEVDVAVLPGQFGVAENGAIWVTEQETKHRVLPFIAQHLVLVLKRENIVANMHHAYRRAKMEETGFGVFIAGPSKTADIEQSLVIGAQGPRSLWVVFEESEVMT